MIGVDQRKKLFEFFVNLLARPDTVSKAEVESAKRSVGAAIKTVHAYRRFRTSLCGYGLTADQQRHLVADARADLHGMIYLDLALQFCVGGFAELPFDEFAGTQPCGGYDHATLPKPDVLRAMCAELWRVHQALTEILSPSRGGSGRTEATPDHCRQAMAAYTPDRDEIKASWRAGTKPGLRALATADTWVALVDKHSPGSSTQEEAHLAPLHIALCRVDADRVPKEASSTPFAVSLYPSLLTALEYFSPVPAMDGQGDLGWWGSLDAIEGWAAQTYAGLLVQRNDTMSPLLGHHLARWDLAQKRPQPAEKQVRVVEGSSHGAAFSLCLMQTIARAHATAQPEWTGAQKK